jgi:cytidylate kinase
MQNVTITITISGPAGSGKTTIATIIQRALDAAGLAVELSPRVLADCLPQHEDGRTLEGLRTHQHKIVITEDQTPRFVDKEKALREVVLSMGRPAPGQNKEQALREVVIAMADQLASDALIPKELEVDHPIHPARILRNVLNQLGRELQARGLDLEISDALVTKPE